MSPPPAAWTRTSPETVVTARPAAASPDREVSRDEIGRQGADAAADRHIAGGGAQPQRRLDVPNAHVAAGRVDLQGAHVLERDVAGRGLRVDRAERAGSIEIRRARPERRDRSPRGQRTRTPTFAPRPIMRPVLFATCTTTSCPAPRSVISTRASAIALRVTSLSRSGTSSTSTPGRSVASTVDLAARERHAQRDVARGLERGHDRASGRGCGRRTTRTPSGRCRGGRWSSSPGSSTLPNSEG